MQLSKNRRVGLYNLHLMKPWRRYFCLLAFLAALSLLHGQKNPDEEEPPLRPAAPVLDGPQFGIRFGYQLQFPSKNRVNALDYSFFEAGHHLGYGGYINLAASDGIQFSPYFGLEHAFWPKSQSYSKACDADSFPTFMDVKDSLPGRDFRFFNLVFEPAFKFYSRRTGLFFKLQPMFAYNIQRKVEQYAHTCGVLPNSQFVDYAPTNLRSMSKFTFSIGGGIVKEVHLPKGGGIALEPGVKVMLSQLLHVEEADPNGLSFDLFPAGVYLNLSFFR